jgi:hypothetical protein
MRILNRRRQKLEQSIVRRGGQCVVWGNMAAIRDSLLHRAAPQGVQAVAQLRNEMDELGLAEA